MSLIVADEPADRPHWVAETLRLVAGRVERDRGELLALVGTASDADLARGSEDHWGLGQVATHLLIVERGVATIALRLSLGEAPGGTGQPRPAAGAVSREGIAVLAARADSTLRRLREGFPASPDLVRMARHPYYGELNCLAWLLTLPNHYAAHFASLRDGSPGALSSGGG